MFIGRRERDIVRRKAAKLFGVGVDDLLGLLNSTGLPKAKQKVVIAMLEDVLSQASR